jgi:hypothetical protein
MFLYVKTTLRKTIKKVLIQFMFQNIKVKFFDHASQCKSYTIACECEEKKRFHVVIAGR